MSKPGGCAGLDPNAGLRLVLAAVATAMVLSVAAGARAEMYKCAGPDGVLIFTTEKGRCPGAKVHVPKGELQSQSQPIAPAARVNPAAAQPSFWASGGADLDDGLEQMWRRKRSEAEAEMSKVDEGLAEVGVLVTGCRKGTTWLVEDKSGLREHLPCAEIKQRQQDLAAKKSQLTFYLAEGLEDECRRSGCLPGWIRH